MIQTSRDWTLCLMLCQKACHCNAQLGLCLQPCALFSRKYEYCDYHETTKTHSLNNKSLVSLFAVRATYSCLFFMCLISLSTNSQLPLFKLNASTWIRGRWHKIFCTSIFLEWNWRVPINWWVVLTTKSLSFLCNICCIWCVGGKMDG